MHHDVQRLTRNDNTKYRGDLSPVSAQQVLRSCNPWWSKSWRIPTWSHPLRTGKPILREYPPFSSICIHLPHCTVYPSLNNDIKWVNNENNTLATLPAAKGLAPFPQWERVERCHLQLWSMEVSHVFSHHSDIPIYWLANTNPFHGMLNSNYSMIGAVYVSIHDITSCIQWNNMEEPRFWSQHLFQIMSVVHLPWGVQQPICRWQKSSEAVRRTRKGQFWDWPQLHVWKWVHECCKWYACLNSPEWCTLYSKSQSIILVPKTKKVRE